jgi:hypothetical protein
MGLPPVPGSDSPGRMSMGGGPAKMLPPVPGGPGRMTGFARSDSSEQLNRPPLQKSPSQENTFSGSPRPGPPVSGLPPAPAAYEEPAPVDEPPPARIVPGAFKLPGPGMGNPLAGLKKAPMPGSGGLPPVPAAGGPRPGLGASAGRNPVPDSPTGPGSLFRPGPSAGGPAPGGPRPGPPGARPPGPPADEEGARPTPAGAMKLPGPGRLSNSAPGGRAAVLPGVPPGSLPPVPRSAISAEAPNSPAAETGPRTALSGSAPGGALPKQPGAAPPKMGFAAASAAKQGGVQNLMAQLKAKAPAPMPGGAPAAAPQENNFEAAASAVLARDFAGCPVSSWDFTDETGAISPVPAIHSLKVVRTKQADYLCDIQPVIDVAQVGILIKLGKTYKSQNPAQGLACVIVAQNVTPAAEEAANRFKIKVYRV